MDGAEQCTLGGVIHIQMCCIGVPGVVVVGNSLFLDAERSPTDFWFTHKYFLLDDNALKNTYTEKEQFL